MVLHAGPPTQRLPAWQDDGRPAEGTGVAGGLGSGASLETVPCEDRALSSSTRRALRTDDSM